MNTIMRFVVWFDFISELSFKGYLGSIRAILRLPRCEWGNLEWHGWINIDKICTQTMVLFLFYLFILFILTHWGRVMHICISKLTTIGSDNGLSPGWCQAIIRPNAGILLIRPLGTNISQILIEILIFSFKKMHLKVSSGKWQPFCLCLNVLMG